MRVYFLAEKECALTVNGAYLGIADGFERSAELDPKDALCCEFAPLGPFLPVRFVLDGDFLLAPPPQVRLYYTENAVAVFVGGFLRADQSLKVLWQKRLNGTLLTLTLQGKLQLHLENETGFHLTELPDPLETCEVRATEDGFLLAGDSSFALLSREGGLLLFSEGRVLSADGTLRAEVPFHDSAGHTAVCEWRNAELVSCSIRTSFPPTEATLALALFEGALIGADCSALLAPEIAGKADRLKSYLGDYRSVVLTAERDKVGLVYERAERVFEVKYFRAALSDGKISNILPL